MASLPAVPLDSGLSRYLDDISKFPILSKDEEFILAKKWRDHQDRNAAHALVTSHLRLAAKIARGYKGYGLPLSEVISEGNIGLMQAVKRFEPDKGFRLSTYAAWWIRATIQEYVLRSWSLVKLSSSSPQKKLFFSLRSAKSAIQAYESGDLSPEHLKTLAKKLRVSEKDVVSMNRRLLASDASLNAPLSSEDGVAEQQDWLVDPNADHAQTLENRSEVDARKSLLMKAVETLSPREQRIIRARRLEEPHLTLETLGHELGVSRERVRQVENRAMEKLQLAVHKQQLLNSSNAQRALAQYSQNHPHKPNTHNLSLIKSPKSRNPQNHAGGSSALASS